MAEKNAKKYFLPKKNCFRLKYVIGQFRWYLLNAIRKKPLSITIFILD